MPAVQIHKPQSAAAVQWVYEFLGVNDYERMLHIEFEEKRFYSSERKVIAGFEPEVQGQEGDGGMTLFDLEYVSVEETLMERILQLPGKQKKGGGRKGKVIEIFTSPESAVEFASLVDPESLRY